MPHMPCIARNCLLHAAGRKCCGRVLTIMVCRQFDQMAPALGCMQICGVEVKDVGSVDLQSLMSAGREGARHMLSCAVSRGLLRVMAAASWQCSTATSPAHGRNRTRSLCSKTVWISAYLSTPAASVTVVFELQPKLAIARESEAAPVL